MSTNASSVSQESVSLSSAAEKASSCIVPTLEVEPTTSMEVESEPAPQEYLPTLPDVQASDVVDKNDEPTPLPPN